MVFNKNHILQAWKGKIISSQEADVSSPFSILKNKNNNQFLNPAGTIIKKTLESLFDEITGNSDMNKGIIESALNDFIRLMAVQKSLPSECSGFLFLLKKILREESGLEINFDEMNIINDRIDSIVLSAFDIYMKCREEIFNIRMNEFKKQSFRIMENVQ